MKRKWYSDVKSKHRDKLMLLKDISLIQLGYQFRARVKKDSRSGIWAVQMKDILENGELDARNLDQVEAKNAKEEHFVTQGAVLFCSKGNRNIATIIRQELSNTLAVAPFFIIRPDITQILPEYLAWYINQKTTQKTLSMYMEGTMLRKLNKSALEVLEIELPSLEQQHRIAELDTLNREEQFLFGEIAHRRKQLIDTALMKQALTR